MSTTDMDNTITVNDLRPGQPCPVCGTPIRAWFARQVRGVEQMDDASCWIESDDVRPTDGIGGGDFAGNIIFIDHRDNEQ